MSLRPRRGQALVLLALTMLLLTLMVFLTLSFSQRVREKMEAQSIADLAAYSSAVATARTFNSIALIRRAETAQLVAMASAQSLISWTTMVRANLNATRVAAAGCAPAAAVLEALDDKNEEISRKWDELDAKAGVQVYNIQRLAWFLNYLQGEMLERLKLSVSGGDKSFAAQFTQLASEGTLHPRELRAGATGVSVAELVTATSGEDYAIDNFMASRGYGFVTKRQGVSAMTGVGGILGALGAAGGSISVTNGGGSTYFSKEEFGFDNVGHGGRANGTYYFFAEDHATVTITFPGCAPLPLDAKAYVRSTDFEDHTDDHAWEPASPIKGKEDPQPEKEYRHTLEHCPDRRYCPNTFVGGIPYNVADHTKQNIWAQPKLFALVERDYNTRGVNADPWNLRFSFTLGANAQTFDNNGLSTAGGIPIGVQQALATGLAYYHRRGHWNEPPNLWNPFWRATLASADIDYGGNPRYGGTDVTTTVQGPAGDALVQLIQNGYRGMH